MTSFAVLSTQYRIKLPSIYILLLLLTVFGLTSAVIQLRLSPAPPAESWNGDCSANCSEVSCYLQQTANTASIWTSTPGECIIELVEADPNTELRFAWHISDPRVTKLNLTLLDDTWDMTDSRFVLNQPAIISTKTMAGSLTGSYINFDINSTTASVTLQNATLNNFSLVIQPHDPYVSDITPELNIKGCKIRTKAESSAPPAPTIKMLSNSVVGQGYGIINIIDTVIIDIVPNINWAAIDSEAKRLTLKIERVFTHEGTIISDFGGAFLMSKSEKLVVDMIDSRLRFLASPFIILPNAGDAELNLLPNSGLKSESLGGLLVTGSQRLNVTLYDSARIGSLRLDNTTIRLHNGSLLFNCPWTSTSGQSLTMVNGTSYGLFTKIVTPWPADGDRWFFDGAEMTFESGSKLVFSDDTSTSEDRFVFHSTTIGDVGFPDRRCELETNRLKLESDLKTFCNVSLPYGATAQAIYTLMAGINAEQVTLTLNNTAHYDLELNFKGFHTVIFNIDPGNDNDTKLRGSTSTLPEIKEHPTYTRIIWKEGAPAPEFGKNYSLYQTQTPPPATGGDVLSLLGDIFQWKLDYPLVSSGPPAIYNVTFRLESIIPLSPQPENPYYIFDPAIAAPGIETPPFEPPVTPTNSPNPSPSSSGCTTVRPEPSNMFTCINGSWVSNDSVTVPSVTVPPNGAVIIFGNLSTGSVVFGGLSSSLTVKGCITSNLSTVLVELTQDDIDKLEKAKDKKITTLLLSSDSEATCAGGINLNNVELKVSSKAKSSCKKVKAEKAKNGSSKTFGAVFTLDSSKCNLWWIILLSVIGGLLIIGVIIVVLLILFVPSVRHAIRPYSRKRAKSPS